MLERNALGANSALDWKDYRACSRGYSTRRWEWVSRRQVERQGKA